MKDKSVCVGSYRTMMIEIVLRCVGNLIVIGALPFRLGHLGAPLWYLPIYAAVAGLMLTVAEDFSFARELFLRADVRSYMRVRIAIIAVLGAMPFVAGMALHLITAG
ncbi:hypothetical protein FHT02_004215 [Sphingomonas xinjiangensis]|uniref:Polysaccharide biosynthesis protein n=2 Tax=Sphingomonas xinjiangensis TaxID=643568 RepID=A0A840YTK6_9SPHN|nr:hypothetical protein [Sphingomonas xinjiangensis]